MIRHWRWIFSIAVIGFGGVIGCVERRITINTEPKGALVYLNDKEVGRTPLTVPFEWYGDYDVVIRKDGYETLKTHEKVVQPWYEYIPIDFFSELLWPATIYDEHYMDFDLKQYQPTDIKELGNRALEMRAQAGSSTSQPTTLPSETPATTQP
jgi:hypothetical protein